MPFEPTKIESSFQEAAGKPAHSVQDSVKPSLQKIVDKLKSKTSSSDSVVQDLSQSRKRDHSGSIREDSTQRTSKEDHRSTVNLRSDSSNGVQNLDQSQQGNPGRRVQENAASIPGAKISLDKVTMEDMIASDVGFYDTRFKYPTCRICQGSAYDTEANLMRHVSRYHVNEWKKLVRRKIAALSCQPVEETYPS